MLGQAQRAAQATCGRQAWRSQARGRAPARAGAGCARSARTWPERRPSGARRASARRREGWKPEGARQAGHALGPDWLDAQRDSPTRSEAEGHALSRPHRLSRALLAARGQRSRARRAPGCRSGVARRLAPGCAGQVKGSHRLRRRLKSMSGQGFALAWARRAGHAACWPRCHPPALSRGQESRPVRFLPRPPSRSGCGGSRFAARSRLVCPAPVRPQGLPNPCRLRRVVVVFNVQHHHGRTGPPVSCAQPGGLETATAKPSRGRRHRPAARPANKAGGGAADRTRHGASGGQREGLAGGRGRRRAKRSERGWRHPARRSSLRAPPGWARYEPCRACAKRPRSMRDGAERRHGAASGDRARGCARDRA